MTIKKAYYYFYYKIYNFSKNISDNILNDIKPVVIIGVSEIFLLSDIMIWYGIITKNDFPDILLYGIGLIIIVFNFYIFMVRKDLKKYFTEFKHYDKKKNIIGGWIVFLTIMLALGSLIFSFYEMSLVDWTKFR